MALINCPECNKEISDKVRACPSCGYPIEELSNSLVAPSEPKKEIAKTILRL